MRGVVEPGEAGHIFWQKTLSNIQSHLQLQELFLDAIAPLAPIIPFRIGWLLALSDFHSDPSQVVSKAGFRQIGPRKNNPQTVRPRTVGLKAQLSTS